MIVDKMCLSVDTKTCLVADTMCVRLLTLCLGGDIWCIWLFTLSGYDTLCVWLLRHSVSGC